MKTYQVQFVDLREGKLIDMQVGPLGKLAIEQCDKLGTIQILGEPQEAGEIA